MDVTFPPSFGPYSLPSTLGDIEQRREIATTLLPSGGPMVVRPDALSKPLVWHQARAEV